jgi:hypothetical protein
LGGASVSASHAVDLLDQLCCAGESGAGDDI